MLQKIVEKPIDVVSSSSSSVSTSSKMEELSGVMIVLIIGGGVLAVTICFIIAKRQIVRFTLRQRRGPHVAVGHDAKKSIKKEIERRIDCIQKIYFEPKLLWDDKTDGKKYILQPDSNLPPYYYRMKAMDDVKELEKEIAKQDGSTRHPRDSLRAFLLTTLAAPLNGSGQRLIHQFCDMYEHARHDPNEFGEEEYQSYQRLLKKLTDATKMLKSFSNSRKSSPNRTPVKKQSKMQSLLDPSRLRPPPMSGTGVGGGVGGPGSDGGNHNARLNLSLGVQLQHQQEQQQQQQQEIDENEILSISQYHGETGKLAGGLSSDSVASNKRIHSEVCGSINPPVWDGSRYFVSFIDDKTHFAMIYLMKRKSKIFERFQEYEALFLLNSFIWKAQVP